MSSTFDVCLRHNSPGAHYVTQAGIELPEILLPLPSRAGIKGLRHHLAIARGLLNVGGLQSQQMLVEQAVSERLALWVHICGMVSAGDYLVASLPVCPAHDIHFTVRECRLGF